MNSANPTTEEIIHTLTGIATLLDNTLSVSADHCRAAIEQLERLEKLEDTRETTLKLADAIVDHRINDGFSPEIRDLAERTSVDLIQLPEKAQPKDPPLEFPLGECTCGLSDRILEDAAGQCDIPDLHPSHCEYRIFAEHDEES